MITSLTLTNFRKHGNLQLDFGPGLVVLRGNNERGKSSLFQAVAYALFGAKALPQPLDEVVTYGQAPATLRVGLSLTLDSREYRIERSKAGCELTWDAGVVTGQTEVTRKVEELVGAPAALATSLFFANQNSIRGALGAGSKATSGLIETLADFGQIDRLIDLIQEHLATGAVKPFEERLAQAEATLAEIGEPAQPADDSEQLALLAAAYRESESKAWVARAEAGAFLSQTLQPLRDQQAKWERAREELVWHTDQHTQARTKQTLTQLPTWDVAADRLARDQLADAEAAERQAQEYRRARRAFDALPKIESKWEGDGASFVAYCETLEKDLQAARNSHTTMQAQLSGLSAQLLTGVCTVCGLDYDAMPTVGSRNDEIRGRIQTLAEDLEKAGEQIKGFEESSLAVKLINRQWQAYREFLAAHGTRVSVEGVQVPPSLVWTAPAPSPSAVAQLRERVQQHEEALKARMRVEGELKLLDTQIAAAEITIARLTEEVAALREGLDEIGPAQGAYVALLEETAAHEAATSNKRDHYVDAKSASEQAQALWKERERTWKLALDQRAQATQQLADVTFNNTLLKKVRSARPAIVDRLWNVILAAVGHYFSLMRGTPSVVSRAEGDFLVDGKPIEGLSGSTLDVLGLAIRVALLKTFLPSCSFLVLDEPAAACDEEREAALIGTIAAASFDQIVLVTHSDLADSFATQLVTL
jgi:DNA repair exonuclease SbcCD ATPase subunit